MKSGNKKEMRESRTHLIIKFEILCKNLEENGFNICELIGEFNDTQRLDDVSEMRHVWALTNLYKIDHI